MKGPWLLGLLSLMLAGMTPQPSVRVLLVGDILLGDAATPLMRAYGPDYPLRRLTPLVSGKDLLIGNLEGPITTAEQPMDRHKAYAYRADVRSAAVLRHFGFDALCLANNHVLDYRLAGLQQTRQALEHEGLAGFGAGDDQAQARTGVVIERQGLRIGLLGFLQPYGKYAAVYPWFATPTRAGVARMDAENLQAAIRDLRPRVDVLIVSFHWGRNYAGVLPIQRRFGRLAIDAGADLVVGHHPHVLQGVEVYRGVPIVYSLGNFAFGSPGRFRQVDPLLAHGWVAEADFRGPKLASLKLRAIATDNHLTGFQARPASGNLPALLARVQRGLSGQLRLHGETISVPLADPLENSPRQTYTPERPLQEKTP